MTTAEVRGQQRVQLGALISLLVSPYVALSLFGSDAQLIAFFPDDAFYYLKTARNLLAVGFTTFDGVNPTNGFHPLYFLLVTALAGWVPGTWFLNAVFLLHVMMMWLAIFLLLARVEALTASGRSVIAAILAFPALFLFTWVSAGMEAPLVVLGTVLLLNAWLAADQLDFRSDRANLWLGTAMTVFMLSRLDLILALMPFVAWLVVTPFRLAGSTRASLTNLLGVLALPLVGGSAYLAFNIATTGHVLPVSAEVKRAFFIPFSVSWRASTGHGNLALTLLALTPIAISLFALLSSARVHHGPAARQRESAFVLAAISVVIYYVYLVSYASNFFRWYFAMPSAASAWIAVHGLSRREFKLQLTERASIVASVAALLVAFASNALFVTVVASSSRSTSWHLLQVAQKLDEVTQSCDVVAVNDAGVIGYFSSRRVINLDGLANGYVYLNEYLRRGRLPEYLDQQGVSVYLLRDQLASNRGAVVSGQYDVVRFAPDTRLELRRRDELFRYAIPDAFTIIAYRYRGRHPACGAARD